jgi:uncharacterized protein YegJ (DUF2314 family)
MPLRALLLVALHLLIAGCDERSAERSTPDRAGISAVAPDDKEMNAAIAEARARMPEFLAVLKRGGPAVDGFSVKAKYETRSGAEYIWVGAVTYDGKSYSGRLENAPRYITGLKFGDAVTVAPEAVSDWLYVEDGRLTGAFTMRVIYRRMSAPEQKAFRDSLQYRFDW